jgi:hypothetical protein
MDEVLNKYVEEKQEERQKQLAKEVFIDGTIVSEITAENARDSDELKSVSQINIPIPSSKELLNDYKNQSSKETSPISAKVSVADSILNLENNFLNVPSVPIKSTNVLAFAELIKDEFADKQKYIEKLLSELDNKYEAIQICGKDIQQLREEKLQLRVRQKF